MSGVWGPTRAELDRTVPLEPPVPRATYIICSTPRSGSGLLCRGLVAAGAGGVPAEYFNPRQRGSLTARWRCGPTAADYAAALRRFRTDDAGTFGLKLHWDQLERLRDEAPEGDRDPAAVLEALFPGARYVHIMRLDLTGQAVSLWRAKLSGVWAERKGEPRREVRPPRYSLRGILECRREIAEQEAEWLRFFRRSGITPVEVVYEQLAAAYGAESARVLEAIGVDAHAIDAEPDGHRQADDASAALAARFERDRARRQVPTVAARVAGLLRRRFG